MKTLNTEHFINGRREGQVLFLACGHVKAVLTARSLPTATCPVCENAGFGVVLTEPELAERNRRRTGNPALGSNHEWPQSEVRS